MSNLIKKHDPSLRVKNVRPISIRPIDATPSTSSESFDQESNREQRVEEEKEKATNILVDAEKEAKKKLTEAKQQVKEIQTQAKEELDEARKRISEEEEASKHRIEEAYEEARSQGWKDGFETGAKEGRNKYEQMISQAQTVIQQANEEYHSTLEKAEPVMLDLALAIANRIIYKSLDDRDGIWLEMVKNAVQEVKDHEEVSIYVPPERYNDTRRQREEIETLLSHTQQLSIYPDASLPETGCLIETPYGRVDASLDSQLEELKSQLFERLKEASYEGNHVD